MKKLIFILSALLVASSAFAIGTLDVPGEDKPQAGSEFLAVYKSKPFLAWTGQERRFLSAQTLAGIGNNRANDICQYFGYTRGLVDVKTVKTMTLSAEGDYAVSFIQNGKLIVLQNAGEGFGSNVVIPSVFTKLTCYL